MMTRFDGYTDVVHTVNIDRFPMIESNILDIIQQRSVAISQKRMIPNFIMATQKRVANNKNNWFKQICFNVHGPCGFRQKWALVNLCRWMAHVHGFEVTLCAKKNGFVIWNLMANICRGAYKNGKECEHKQHDYFENANHGSDPLFKYSGTAMALYLKADVHAYSTWESACSPA